MEDCKPTLKIEQHTVRTVTRHYILETMIFAKNSNLKQRQQCHSHNTRQVHNIDLTQHRLTKFNNSLLYDLTLFTARQHKTNKQQIIYKPHKAISHNTTILHSNRIHSLPHYHCTQEQSSLPQRSRKTNDSSILRLRERHRM